MSTNKKPKAELLKLSDLVFDQINELYYPRMAVDWQTVANYKKKMDAGETFPNPKVGRLRNISKNIVIDGRHTIEAMKQRGAEFTTCDIYYFDSEKDLFIEAVKFNARHGRPLSQEDEELIITRLQEYKCSVDEIQKIVHVPASEIKRETFEDEKTNGYTVSGPGGRKTFVALPKPKPKPKEQPKVEVDLNPGTPTMSFAQIEKRNNELQGIIDFKNSLKRAVNYLETNSLPVDAESRELMKRLRGLMIIEAD